MFLIVNVSVVLFLLWRVKVIQNFANKPCVNCNLLLLIHLFINREGNILNILLSE